VGVRSGVLPFGVETGMFPPESCAVAFDSASLEMCKQRFWE